MIVNLSDLFQALGRRKVCHQIIQEICYDVENLTGRNYILRHSHPIKIWWNGCMQSTGNSANSWPLYF